MHKVEQLRQMLKQHPLGLLFDIDGTLSAIAPTPREAYLHPEVPSLLEQLKQQAHIAIVTGRSVKSGAALVNVDGIIYAGSHGLEWCDGLPGQHAVQLAPEALPYVEAGKHLLKLAEQEFSGMQGVLIEHKRVGGGIHYRLCTDPEQARQRILELLEEPVRQSAMRLSEGKRIVEIRPPVAIDKGEVVRRFVERLGIRGAMFAGDDRTDMDAMRELKQLRAEGVTTLAVVVRHLDTQPELLELADIVVEGVEGMVALLREIVRGNASASPKQSSSER